MRLLTLKSRLLAAIGTCLLCWLSTSFLAAQDTLKVKDAGGTVMLEVRQDGVIVRKVSTSERNAISGLTSADNGLMVYDTDEKSLWLWKDTEWVEIEGVDNIDEDNDPTNELQDWYSLPDIPAGFADGVDDVNDADHDPTNETNIGLNLNANILSITDAGGTLSTDLSSLTGYWSILNGKVYNSSNNIGIGVDTPTTALHVQASKGLGEYVMLIENLNHEGSGLKIKIDGSHPLFIHGEGENPDFFLTNPGSAALTIFDGMISDVSDFLQTSGIFDFSNINFDSVITPGSLLDDLGLSTFIAGGLCKGAENLVGLVNGIGQGVVALPDLALGALPPSIPDIPTNFPNLSFPNLGWNPPDPCIDIWNGPIIDLPPFCIPLNFTLPLASLNSTAPIVGFNAAINGINGGINTVNNTLESGYGLLKAGLVALDDIDIPIPQLQVPTQLGPITCPNPNPWDNFNISFEALNPLNYSIVNPMSTDNAFITFADQYDNKLGAITAQGLDEFNIDYFNPDKVLEIASAIAGLISDDGNIVENAIQLVKEAVTYYLANDGMGVLYSSGHGDYAEWLEREDINERIGFGDIVGIRGGKISLSLDHAEQVMVVSKAPIVLGNIPTEGEEFKGNNVAFIGQVPVKVMGPVHTGDFILANPEMPGYGVAASADGITAEQLRLAVGKSWETNDTPGFKYVNTIVGMHNNSWAIPIRNMQQQLDTQANTMRDLSERMDRLERIESTASVSKKDRR